MAILNRPFNIALLVSVLWHLTLGSVFTIVIAPASTGQAKFTTINFLGPILLEDAARVAVASKEPLLMSVQSEWSRRLAEKMVAKLPEMERARIEEKEALSARAWDITMAGSLSKTKLAPEAFLEQERDDYEPIPSRIKGPAAAREIIFKPQLPPLVHWPAKIEQDLDVDSFEVELKFWVSSDGKVEFVEKSSSCGYPQIDLMAIRYMRMWQFAPLDAGTQDLSQWGKMKLTFRQLQ